MYLTRRAFFKGTVGVLSAWAAAGLVSRSEWARLAQAFELRDVAAAQGTDDDTPETLLRTALEPLGGIERFVSPGQSVAIKPNITWANPPRTASSTDPDLLRAVIQAVQRRGASRIIVMDHCTLSDNLPADTLRISGIGKVIEQTGVEKVVLAPYEPASRWASVEIPRGQLFTRRGVIKEATQVDVRINLAVAKSHIVTPVTLCLKHMMGFLQDPAGLHATPGLEGIADINTAPAIKCQLHILEAIRVRLTGAAYGDGTDKTDPKRVKRFNQVIVGTDPVLIDAYAAETFFKHKAPPRDIPHIYLSYKAGVGDIDVAKALASGKMGLYQPSAVLATKPGPEPTISSAGRPLVSTSPESEAWRQGQFLDFKALLSDLAVPIVGIVALAGLFARWHLVRAQLKAEAARTSVSEEVRADDR